MQLYIQFEISKDFYIKVSSLKIDQKVTYGNFKI